MGRSTLQRPHLCGACESPITPYRSVEDGRQCSCAEPSCPAPVPDGALCFYAKDPAGLEQKRIDTAPLEQSLNAVERMRLELGTTPAELIAEHVENVRTELLEARKLADRFGEGELHRKACEITSDVDDYMAMLADRSRS